jgi:hypothetical protein
MKNKICAITLIICLAAAAYAANSTCSTCGGNTTTAPADTKETRAPGMQAGKITVEKTAPERITKGDTLKIVITLTNTYPTTMSASIKEQFGGADEVNMEDFKRSSPVGSSVPPYYKKTVDLPKNSLTTVSYEIKPLYYGPYMISGTEVSTSAGTISSNPLTVYVECNQNKICEPDLDENALTCPQDCQPDKTDNMCNPIRDRICDPDCSAGQDPDCTSTTTTIAPAPTTTNPAALCPNKICDKPEENHKTCPKDCPSGGKDSYCDKVNDGICDSDCDAGEDPDCAVPGNTGPIIIIVLFILALALIIAYKKRWLKIGQ